MSKDLVFIASGGRTGTTFFGERLEEVVADCHSEHEPDVLARNWEKATARIKKFGVWHMVFGRILGISGLRVIGHNYLAGKIDDEECIKRLREQRADYFGQIDKSLIVESSWRYWMMAPVLPQAFPGCRIIGVVRDARDWIESWSRYMPQRHRKSVTGWFPQGPLTPAQVGDTEWADQWDNLDPFGRLAWDWRIITRELARADASGDHVRVFKFEELFDPDSSDRVEELIHFAAFDGKYGVTHLAGFTQRVRTASSGPRIKWQSWTPEQVRLVDAMCGDLMRQYGYGNEPEWLAKLEEAGVTAKAA